MSPACERHAKDLWCRQNRRFRHSAPTGTCQSASGDRTVIANAAEYQKAQEEISSLEERLARLLQAHPAGSKGFTKAGIRKTIARLHEELAVYEGSEEARNPDSN